jgi:hypothetical protein
MNDPIRIKRIAIQVELDDGRFMHIYSEDPAVLTIEHKVDVAFSGYPLMRPDILDQETTLEVTGLRNYRITQGRPFGQQQEIDEQKGIEQ